MYSFDTLMHNIVYGNTCTSIEMHRGVNKAIVSETTLHYSMPNHKLMYTAAHIARYQEEEYYTTMIKQLTLYILIIVFGIKIHICVTFSTSVSFVSSCLTLYFFCQSSDIFNEFLIQLMFRSAHLKVIDSVINTLRFGKIRLVHIDYVQGFIFK